MRVTRLIPSPVRARLKEALRRRAVSHALRPLRSNGTLTPPEIANFARAWGNTGFAPDKDYLAQLLKLLDRGPVLECGSGGTTLLANELGTLRGYETFSLEQDAHWAEPAKLALRGSPSTTLLTTPLRSYGGYQWYDVPEPEALPKHFALIICDGPYIDRRLGEPFFSAWRYGVLPWLHEHGRTFDTLLLDDVDDPRAPPVLDRWRKEFGVELHRIRSEAGEIAIVTSASQRCWEGKNPQYSPDPTVRGVRPQS